MAANDFTGAIPIDTLLDSLVPVQLAARDAELRYLEFGLTREAAAVREAMTTVTALVWAGAGWANERQRPLAPTLARAA